MIQNLENDYIECNQFGRSTVLIQQMHSYLDEFWVWI